MPPSDSEQRELEQWLVNTARQVADVASWPAPRSHDLAKLLFRGVLVYGLSSDESHVQSLRALYNHCIDNLALEVRLDVYRQLRDRTMHGESSINTLLPFLFEETAPSLMSEVVIDYCMTVTPPANDPLRATKDICRWLQMDVVGNRGAAFAGLLCLGDDRVMSLLDSLKWTLGRDEVRVSARCVSAMPSIAQVDFWLSWAEEAVASGLGESSLFGTILLGLVELEKQRRVAEYHMSRRNFGYLAASREAQTPAPPIQVLRKLTPADVATRYDTRLHALEAAEPPPKLTSDVLTVFGLEPKAPVELRGVFQ